MTIKQIRKTAAWLTVLIIALSTTVVAVTLVITRVESLSLFTGFFNRLGTPGRLGLIVAAVAAVVCIASFFADRFRRRFMT